MKTRSDIQGLRALAVALVVLSHANLLHLTGGYVGVDVFFVISGYLITSIILREYAANAAISNGLGWFSLRAFYLRRFKRIVPAAMLVLLVTTIVSYLVFNSVRAHGIAIDALWSVFFFANLHFINLATDYFQQGFSTSPLQHFWSLAVEEQFYLIFPTLLLGALSIHGMKIRNYALNWRRRVGILIGVISLASFGWAVYATHSNPASSYFSSFSRAWELGLGALLAIFAQSSKAYLPLRLRQLVSGIGLLAILVTALLFTSATPFPGLYTLIPTLGTALIIGSGINSEEGPETFIQKISNFAPIAYLGTISYSVYLWHLPILIIASQRYSNKSSKLWFKLVLIAAILLISAFTYYLYEGPLRHKIKVPAGWYQNKFQLSGISRNFERSSLVGILGYGLAGVAVVASVALVYLPSSKNENSVKKSYTQSVAPAVTQSASVRPTPELSYSYLLGDWQRKIGQGLTVTSVKNLTPTFQASAGVSRSMYPDCNRFSPNFESQNKDVQFCSAGTGSKTAFLIGNSHARMFQTAVTEPLIASGYTVYSIFIGSCSIENITIYNNGSLVPFCDEYHSAIQSFLKTQHPNLVVLSESLTVTDFDFQNVSYTGSAGFKKFSELYLSSLKDLRKLTDQLIILGQTPSLLKSPVDCVDSHQNFSSICRADGGSITSVVDLQRKYSTETNSVFLDTRDWLCRNRVNCPIVINNALVYADRSHLTYAIEKYLAPLFLSFLRQENIVGASTLLATPVPVQSSTGESIDSNTYPKLLNTWRQKIDQGLSLKKVPLNLDPPWTQISVPSAYTDNCLTNMNHVGCTYGNPHAVHHVVIMGDSYAVAIIPMVMGALDLTQWSIVSLTWHQCMIADVVPMIGTGQLQPNAGCQSYRHWAFGYLAVNHPDLVILADNANISIKDPSGQVISSPGDSASAYWLTQLNYSLTRISSITKKFVYFGTVPTSTAISDCVDSKLAFSSTCLARPSGNSVTRAYEHQLTIRFGGIFLDPEPWLCDQFACPAVIDNSPVHPDGSHLGVTFSSKIGPLFYAFLRDQKLI